MEMQKEIWVFDIDDTILKSESKVRYIDPTTNKKCEVTTEEYAKIRHTLPKDIEYDWTDFREGDVIYNHLIRARPHLPGLRYLDEAINKNIPIGFITARGAQKHIFMALKKFLKYRDFVTKNLKKIPSRLFQEKHVFGVYDSKTQALVECIKPEGAIKPSTAQAKLYILQEVFIKKYGYTKIKFFEDDKNNIAVVRQAKDEKITVIDVTEAKEKKSGHPVELSARYDKLKLAEDLTNLRYDSLSAFLKALSQCLIADSEKDLASGRRLLAKNLKSAGMLIASAGENIDMAWKICEPYMQDSKDKN